jgi:hypothetical protein
MLLIAELQRSAASNCCRVLDAGAEEAFGSLGAVVDDAIPKLVPPEVLAACVREWPCR